MNLTRKALLTRKEIAGLLEVSVDQVRKNEGRWGLGPARVDLNARCVRYRCLKALAILEGRGFIEREG